ncbi:MAG: GAF domain-containing sensor histidine kinase [Acidimicrobiia bacterium]|nr:GAF domain-containing sensor histidine kinase [Acidimicrobiia bacterium]
MLYRRWLSLRGPIAIAAVCLGLVLGVVLDWPAAFGVSVLGLVLGVDALLRRTKVMGSVVGSVMFDTTLMGLTLWLLRTPPAVIAIPFAYLIATAFLLLPPQRAALPVGYAVGWLSLLLIGSGLWWEPESGSRAVFISLLMAGVFVASLIVMFAFTSRAMGSIRVSLDRKVRFEKAISACSRAFATGDSDTSLDRALGALLVATEATAVFVEQNVDDPERGLCSTLVAEVLMEGTEPDPVDRWTLVPWSEMPVSFAGLSNGRPVAFQVADLPSVERARYKGTGHTTELSIPIMVRGSWVGLIGFNDIGADSLGDSHDIELLRTAAELIAAYWERIEAREQLKEAMANLEYRHRLEHALAQRSGALLASRESAIDDALGALLEATAADIVFVEENFQDDELGPCARITHWAADEGAPGIDPTAQPWSGPFSALPSLYAKLQRGEPSAIATTDLADPERGLYLADGILSELCLPIFVRGEWRGTIGFSDSQDERRWTEEDIRFLRTAGEMVGAFWDRQETVTSLNTRLAYEEALAKVSRELISGREDALEAAFEHLAAVTGADYMWLEEVFDDPDAGMSSRVVHALQPPNLEGVHIADLWMGGSHRDTPTTPGRLARGEASILHTEDLDEGTERSIYEADGLRSELVIPVFVFGKWTGAIGFADYLQRREWHENDIGVLRTAGGLVGSYLERQETSRRLEQLVASKDEFIASISHEIRTPLTAVLGFTNVIREGFDDLSDSDRLEMLDLINREAQDVAWIVEDLLVYARADIGTLAAVAIDLNLGEQIAAVLAGQPSDLGSRVSVRSNGERAAADPARVRQIVRNLLTNAMKYGGPNVEVETARRGPFVVMRVIDDGRGIDEKHRDRVFAAYFRAHASAGQPGSIGLGLHVSRKLARLMGGDLGYDREDGRSCFILTLPAAGELKVASA